MKGESSVELLAKARAGDDEALERLLQYHVPRLRRWATGRLPAWARDRLAANRLLEWTHIVSRHLLVQRHRRRPAVGPADRVPDAVDQGLAQIGLEGALVLWVEALYLL